MTDARGASAWGNRPGALIQSLHIENLKSLSGSHEVELAPLTLIYGPNAAGKSSVLQSTRLAKDWLKRINRPFIESDENSPSEERGERRETWEDIIDEHLRLVSGHDPSLPLNVGMAYSSSDLGEHLGQLIMEVRSDDHDPRGFRVMTTTSDSTGTKSTTFASAPLQESWGSGFRFHPQPDSSGPMESADRLLEATVYLGPHRGDPRKRYEYRESQYVLWHEGPGSLEAEPINRWLSHLGVPYTVRAVTIEEADPEYGEYLDTLDRTADWVDEGVPQSGDLDHFELSDTRSGVQVLLKDVGYGVGQLLPIVDFCTREADRVICIEQPELHLHPRLQGNLGELFVDSVMRGNQIIAETHSENILLRVRRLIREERIAAHDVSVIYVDNSKAGVMIRRLRLGPSGELLDPWPSGFFDDSLADVLGGWE